MKNTQFYEGNFNADCKVAIYGSENGLVAYQFHEYEPSDVI
jgi:hypothetical protein